jgi:hypothetical protein
MTERLMTTLLALAISLFSCASLAEMDGERMLDATIYGAVDGLFTETERQLITDYFHNDYRYHDDKDGKHHKKNKNGKKQKGLPPGLAKREQLPPGLQKQLERNGTLPPGLAKRALPEDLQGRLSPVHHGYERVIVDSNVLLVEKASGIISDIIKDIVQ